MKIIEQNKDKIDRFVILISSNGGDVYSGISAYNFLVGIPNEIITHNFGTVDSIANVIFCAGTKRYCTPDARFLIHGVSVTLQANQSYDEKKLDEGLKALRLDEENMVGIIAKSIKKKEKIVMKAMSDRTTLNPEQAQNYGLVHEIKKELFPKGAVLVSIYETQSQQQSQQKNR